MRAPVGTVLVSIWGADITETGNVASPFGVRILCRSATEEWVFCPLTLIESGILLAFGRDIKEED
jgi:hypothetical protein